jgi:hypothetical protein
MISKKLLIRSEILFMIQFQSVMMNKIIKYKEHGELSQKLKLLIKEEVFDMIKFWQQFKVMIHKGDRKSADTEDIS